jgi:deoxyribonucleoside regulator
MEGNVESKYDISLMVKVAHMYHEDGMKQDEIAGKLQISRAMISMILYEARDVGIVEINIRNPLVNNEVLSNELIRLFELKECVVIPTSLQDSHTLRKLVAERAVDILNRELESQKTIGITWGRTCYQFVSAFNLNKNVKDTSVVSLIGGSDQKEKYYQLNEMVRTLAEKVKGLPYFLHAPALASSIDEKEVYLNCASMQTIMERWKNIDIVITGVGSLPKESSNEREAYIGENEVGKTYAENEAVGDICARYFKINGEFIKDNFYDRVIGIPIEDVRNAKTVIGIATGMDKFNSILGALRTQILDVFITDEQTAKAVIKASKLTAKEIN